MKFADSHCHLTSNLLIDQVDLIIKDSQHLNIDYFVQGGICPEEWELQIKLAEQYKQIIPVFGIHPMWIAEQNSQTIESALDFLSKKIHLAKAIGEVGLDFRPQFIHSRELQIEAVLNQIEIAQFKNIPIVWHLVRCFEDIKNNPLMSDWFSQTSGYVHAFNGGWEQAHYYLQNGLKLSVGGAVTFPTNKKLHDVIKKINLESLLIETDSPDQKIFQSPTENNYPKYLWSIATTISEIKNLPVEKILERSTQNLFSLLNISY